MNIELQTYAAHRSAILKLGLPLVASNMAQFAIHMTGTIMLGWYDVTALAAVTLATSLFFVVFIVGSGFAFAVTPMVAAAAEAGDEVQVRRVTRMGIWLSVIYGFIFTLPFLWAEPILLAMGQDPVVSAAAQDYLVIVAWQMTPALLVMTLRSYLAALEHTAVILWATVGTALMNVTVNYALIFGNWGAPELGIQGAAIASLLVTLGNVIILIAYGLYKLPQYDLLKNIWKSDWEIFRRVFKLGYPIGLTSLAEGGLFAASAIMMGWIGAIELAAHGIAIQLASLTFMIHIGFSQAATVRAGRALGRHDEPNLRRGARMAIALSAFVAFITVAIFLLFPELLINAFIDPTEPEKDRLLSIGIGLLAMAALFQVVDALQVMALGLLRGVQDTAVPMIMATICYWVIGMPTSYLLAFRFGMGGIGLWLGLVVGLSFAAAMMMWRFWMRSVRITRPRSAHPTA